MLMVSSRVSNGTEFSCPKGQRDRHEALVPGQRDSGTRKLFLSRDKGTTGQAQNLATGQDGPGFFETVLSWDVPWDKMALYFEQFCCFQKKK